MSKVVVKNGASGEEGRVSKLIESLSRLNVCLRQKLGAVQVSCVGNAFLLWLLFCIAE
jgi:hypothetical protein